MEDVSNVDEWEQSQRDIDIERQSFNGNLSYVLQRLTTEIPDLEYRCAVAGPGVLGDDRAVKPKE